MHTGYMFETPKKTGRLIGLRIDGIIILKWILERWDSKAWVAFT